MFLGAKNGKKEFRPKLLFRLLGRSPTSVALYTSCCDKLCKDTQGYVNIRLTSNLVEGII